MSQLLELLAEHKRKSERPITRKKASIQDDKKRASREGKTAQKARCASSTIALKG
jgi:hypothetical protein